MDEPSIPTSPLPIEETPEIPIEETPPVPPIPKTHGVSVLTILIFILICIAGIFLFRYARPLLWNMKQIATPMEATPTPTPIDPFASWKTYAIAGISYRLPSEVLAPICDGTGCISQGTYLPGGTRLTLAVRGSRAFVTDANGVSFVNKEATISGYMTTEFSGTFSGRTTGGYGFTQMHGFMIEISPTQTLETNHFTPTGVTADWVRDDALFEQIISNLDVSSDSATMK